jgi:hypothetical protein
VVSSHLENWFPLYALGGMIAATVVAFWAVLHFENRRFDRWVKFRDSHHCLPYAQSGPHPELAGKVMIERNYIVWMCDGGELVER